MTRPGSPGSHHHHLTNVKCELVGISVECGVRVTLESISNLHSFTMESLFTGLQFQKEIRKWRGMAKYLKPAERSGLPAHLRDRKILYTDSHVDKEDAARAVDK